MLPAALVAASVIGCTTDPTPRGAQPPGSSGTAAAAPPAIPAIPAMGQREFIELSAVLTGVAVHHLDLSAATALNLSFADQSAALLQLKGQLDAQADHAAPTIPAEHVALARSLMTGWYTGMVGKDIATWTGALSWTVPHATAPGACAGFGTWAVPPMDGAM